MELDELKAAWMQYDKKLTDNLRINETLLHNMNLDKVKRELNTPLYFELLSMVIGFIGTLFFIGFMIKHMDESKLFVTALVGVALGTFYLVLSIVKSNRILKIDYLNSSIVKLQYEILSLKVLVLRARKTESSLLPLFVIAILVIAFKAVHNINLFERPSFLLVEMVLGVSLSFVLMIWISKHFYDKKLENAEHHLKEIERFNTEE
jgi:hypothetical protein